MSKDHSSLFFFFFFQAEDGIRDKLVTGVQTCALPISTVNPMDVTDTFQEKIVLDPTSPSGLSTVFKGNLEHIIPIPEVFRTNNIGDHILNNIAVVPPGNGIPPATLIVPRRNNGPLITLDIAHGVGLSVQYTGFSATREVDTFLAWDAARGLRDFFRGLSFFDVGSQNFAYSDIRGNIARSEEHTSELQSLAYL